MGLFDFFKKKEITPQADASTKPPESEKEEYLGDLDKTNILFGLLKIPKPERDQKWQQRFLENISHASFRCGDPQVIVGPDGFPYFQLFLPEPHKAFQCFVIDRMKDDFLLKSGYGVVINPTENSADWVLSSGDIVNYHINGTFYTETETPFSKETESETISQDEEVMVGQPTDELLPRETRNTIAAFLKGNGIDNPKIMLMMRKRKDGNGVSQDLVFNLTIADFPDQDTCNSVMKAIRWYLPSHYSYVGMNEKNLESGFMPL